MILLRNQHDKPGKMVTRILAILAVVSFLLLVAVVLFGCTDRAEPFPIIV